MKPYNRNSIISRLFNIQTDMEFNDIALELFQWQAQNIPVFRDYINYLGVDSKSVKSLLEIPFLPIQFFKSYVVLENSELKDTAQAHFMSSGTTATGRSNHYVIDLKLYEQSFLKTFNKIYGHPEEMHIIALLPSYLEQGNSSLIYMMDHLIKQSKSSISGFYSDYSEVSKVLNQIEDSNEQCLLFGVTYALLDLIESKSFKLKNTIVMETGGMKGRRKEITKSELHQILKNGYGVDEIHSEYGMTELLSQGYSRGDEWFEFPNWMKCFLRPVNDPLTTQFISSKTGGINIIDLANVDSCAFIATQDLGRIDENERLKIMGRFDHSDTRGCNLLIQ